MAKVDYFLKLDGIQGESQDAKHKNEIELQSFNWGASQAGVSFQGGGLGAGKVQMHDFSCTMYVNQASPKLMVACATGQHIKSAVITGRKAGKDAQDFLVITFSDLLVTNYKDDGHASADIVPQDYVSFAYSKVDYEYKIQKADGTLGGSTKASFDVKQNKAS